MKTKNSIEIKKNIRIPGKETISSTALCPECGKPMCPKCSRHNVIQLSSVMVKIQDDLT